jgi:hypothetical protein
MCCRMKITNRMDTSLNNGEHVVAIVGQAVDWRDDMLAKKLLARHTLLER